MALTESEKIKTYKILQLPYESVGTINTQLNNLTSAEEAEVKAVIAQYATVEYKKQTINAEGFRKDTSELKIELKKQMMLILRMGAGFNGYRIARG